MKSAAMGVVELSEAPKEVVGAAYDFSCRFIVTMKMVSIHFSSAAKHSAGV